MMAEGKTQREVAEYFGSKDKYVVKRLLNRQRGERRKLEAGKTECIYRHKPATFSEANEMIDRYIHFYNHECIQIKTGEAPLTQRLSD